MFYRIGSSLYELLCMPLFHLQMYREICSMLIHIELTHSFEQLHNILLDEPHNYLVGLLSMSF